ncbi:PREDICTED: fasciclin-1-like [Priapulus caudatus]|uniref:Fasciclin-1-like n=1 Tax=Priapulus caudatus TaxID=37621 RepID=A0ABM1EAZ0_PRICU|nr:PREDICTED: fasciclin-1-like [Priapulus caudatus]
MTSSVDGLLTGDVYARVVKANIACENGVVHIIDNVLAYIYKSIDVTLMTSKNMSLVWHDVLSKAVMAPLRERLMQDDVTVFVPSNSAFEKLPIQKQTELLADEENLYKLMELHILDGRVDLMGQDNQSTLDTMNPDKKLRLNIIINDTAQTYYVNGDGVWAEVVQSNVGATNGVVHLIDTILGFPYQTVWEHITENPELTGIRRNVEKASNTMKEYMSIENEKLTFFAPNNDAFLDMYRQRYDDYEALTQGEPDVLENVLETHLLRGQVVTLDDLVDNMQLSTINGKTLVLKHDEFDSDRWHISDGTVEAEIIRGQKMTNGFIYIIDRVLYTSGDIKHAKGGDSAEVSGSLAPCWRISGLLLQIITTVHVLRVAIFNC